jgi:hypothetical protein
MSRCHQTHLVRSKAPPPTITPTAATLLLIHHGFPQRFRVLCPKMGIFLRTLIPRNAPDLRPLSQIRTSPQNHRVPACRRVVSRAPISAPRPLRSSPATGLPSCEPPPPSPSSPPCSSHPHRSNHNRPPAPSASSTSAPPPRITSLPRKLCSTPEPSTSWSCNNRNSTPNPPPTSPPPGSPSVPPPSSPRTTTTSPAASPLSPPIPTTPPATLSISAPPEEASGNPPPPPVR